MKQRIGKWRKWQIGAGGAAALFVLFSTVQNSTAFQEKIQSGANGSGPASESDASAADRDRLMDDWRSGSMDNGGALDGDTGSRTGRHGRRGGAFPSDGAAGGGSPSGGWSQSDSGGGMSSRSGGS